MTFPERRGEPCSRASVVSAARRLRAGASHRKGRPGSDVEAPSDRHSVARKCATRAFAWPCPSPCSVLSRLTSSMCLAGRALFKTPIQWEIGLPYVFSMDGKYEAGPLAFVVSGIALSLLEPRVSPGGPARPATAEKRFATRRPAEISAASVMPADAGPSAIRRSRTSGVGGERSPADRARGTQGSGGAWGLRREGREPHDVIGADLATEDERLDGCRPAQAGRSELSSADLLPAPDVSRNSSLAPDSDRFGECREGGAR